MIGNCIVCKTKIDYDESYYELFGSEKNDLICNNCIILNKPYLDQILIDEDDGIYFEYGDS